MQFGYSRRLVGAMAIGLLAGVFTSSPSLAQDKIELKYSNPAVPEDWHVKGMEIFRDKLEELAPGRFDVKIFANGTLFKQGAEMAAIQRGNLELAHFNMQDLTVVSPPAAIFTTPYLLRDYDHMKKVMEGEPGQWLFKTIRDEAGIQPLSTFLLGTRQVGLRYEKDVQVPADLSGVKMRMVNTPEWLFMGNALGASATPMAFSELYLALQQGTVDAEDAQPSTVRAAKLDEVLKQMVMTGHLVQPLVLTIRGDLYDSLTPEEQKAVTEAALAAAAYNDENRRRDEDESVEKFKANGMKVTTPNLEAFREHVLGIYLASDYAKTWPEGMYDKILAVK